MLSACCAQCDLDDALVAARWLQPHQKTAPGLSHQTKRNHHTKPDVYYGQENGFRGSVIFGRLCDDVEAAGTYSV